MLTVEDQNDLFESIGLLIEHYIRINIHQYIQPTFHSNMVRDITLAITQILEETEMDLADWVGSEVEHAVGCFYKHIIPPRANGPSFIRVKPNINHMHQKIAYLQQVPQPEQRTPEWYEFRYKHLTASNIWKVFISESTRNQLIYEKCQPLNVEKYSGSGSGSGSGSVSLESPMHWGQKYEPLSVMLYEKIYDAPVSDFGCIPHKTIEFLAASPDGIVTAASSLRYGRMLEVKNIVNREINGNPKMEYWVQMQLQMEVCELNECDFLETRFQEYPDQATFEADAETPYKGMLMLFMTSSGKPVYEYAPLELDLAELETWQEAMMDKNPSLMWLKNIYWKLDQLSCVLVLRNKAWFAAALPQLKEIWATIEREKQTGYSHREPKKAGLRVKKIYPAGEEDIEMKAQCFINIET